MTEKVMETSRLPIEPATVTLVIPCAAEYVSVARLAILGIASRMAFSYDEVEDVRLAVGEACTHAVERAKAAAEGRGLAALTGANGASSKKEMITITSSITDTTLMIDVADNVAASPFAPSAATEDLEESDVDHQGLGALLIEILVDEVSIDSRADGTTISLKKHAPAAS